MSGSQNGVVIKTYSARLISLPAPFVFYVTCQVCLKINTLSHARSWKYGKYSPSASHIQLPCVYLLARYSLFLENCLALFYYCWVDVWGFGRLLNTLSFAFLICTTLNFAGPSLRTSRRMSGDHPSLPKDGAHKWAKKAAPNAFSQEFLQTPDAGVSGYVLYLYSKQ